MKVYAGGRYIIEEQQEGFVITVNTYNNCKRISCEEVRQSSVVVGCPGVVNILGIGVTGWRGIQSIKERKEKILYGMEKREGRRRTDTTVRKRGENLVIRS